MNNTRLMLIAQWEGKLPNAESLMLVKQLEGVDEETLAMLMAVQFKDPIIGLVLGFLFGMFGVDRFYKGDIGLGVVKLLSFFLSFVCGLITFGFFWIPAFIWLFIDFFLVWRGIKKRQCS